MIHVLLIEDDTRISGFIKRGLEAEGFVVTHSSRGGEGAILARKLDNMLRGQTSNRGVLVLDLNLPDVHGLDLCRSLRRQGMTLPIMMLTAMTETRDKVSGLTGGADDYMTKPFAFDELVARIRNLTKRVAQENSTGNEDEVALGRLYLSRVSRDARIENRWLGLTAKEFSILSMLASPLGQIVTRERLEVAIWGAGQGNGTNVVNVHISNLRRKIGKGPNLPAIRALRGRGFMLAVSAYLPQLAEYGSEE